MGFRFVPFPDLRIRVCAGGIKITQADVTDAVSPIVIFQNLFDHQFCSTVGINRHLGMIFRHGNFDWIAIGGAA